LVRGNSIFMYNYNESYVDVKNKTNNIK
jgi:hypothetical protein